MRPYVGNHACNLAKTHGRVSLHFVQTNIDNMKKTIIALLLISLILPASAQKIYWGDEVPDNWTGNWAEEYLTTPEKSEYTKSSSSTDVLEFINTMRWNSEYVHIVKMFTTIQGRTGVAAVLANPRITSPEEAKESGKPIIYLQGDIHPPEAEGKEGLMMLMRDILIGDKGYLLDNQILIICPDFCPDGTDNLQLNQGTPHLIGGGRSGQGYNLNREGIKLESTEVNGLNKNILNKWDPILFFDAHAMSRVKHGYAICYATSQLPTANQAPRDYVWETMFPDVRNKIRSNFGLETFTHCIADEENWPPTEWSHHRAYWFLEGKFVTTAYGLRNRMAVLVETPGHPSFERRIYAQYAYIHEMLEYTNKHGYEMKEICEKTDAYVINNIKENASSGQLKNFVDGEYQSYGKVDILAYKENVAELIPGTSIMGTKPGTADGPPVLIKGVEHMAKPVGTKEANVPRGYLLPAYLSPLVEKLRTHNIKVEVLKEPMTVSGEEFIIDSLRHIKWMSFTLTRLDGKFVKSSKKTFPAGTFHIDMAQPNANLAFYCLEPETPDGFTGWRLMDDYLISNRIGHSKKEYPVFKYFKRID